MCAVYITCCCEIYPPCLQSDKKGDILKYVFLIQQLSLEKKNIVYKHILVSMKYLTEFFFITYFNIIFFPLILSTLHVYFWRDYRFQQTQYVH